MEIKMKNGNVLELFREVFTDSPLEITDGNLWDWASNCRKLRNQINNYWLSPDEVLERYFNRKDNTTAEWESDDYLLIPIYAYDHGDITISLNRFYDEWDSGVAYVACISKYAYRKEYGRWNRKKALESLGHLVEEMDCWLKGNVYGFRLESAGGKWIDHCGFFYGFESLIDYLKENHAENIDAESLDNIWEYEI